MASKEKAKANKAAAKAKSKESEETGQHLIQSAQEELQKRLAAEIARIFGQ